MKATIAAVDEQSSLIGVHECSTVGTAGTAETLAETCGVTMHEPA